MDVRVLVRGRLVRLQSAGISWRDKRSRPIDTCTCTVESPGLSIVNIVWEDESVVIDMERSV